MSSHHPISASVRPHRPRPTFASLSPETSTKTRSGISASPCVLTSTRSLDSKEPLNCVQAAPRPTGNTHRILIYNIHPQDEAHVTTLVAPLPTTRICSSALRYCFPSRLPLHILRWLPRQPPLLEIEHPSDPPRESAFPSAPALLPRYPQRVGFR